MGQYDSNSSDSPLLFLRTPVNTSSYAEMVEMWLIPQLRQRSHGNCVAAAWWSTYIFCPHCVTLWMNIFEAIGITVVHLHFPHYYPEHLIVLILPYQKTLYGAVKRNKQLWTILTVSCTRLWNRYLLPLCHTCFEACHKECGNIPGCILNITVSTYSRSTWCTVVHHLISEVGLSQHVVWLVDI